MEVGILTELYEIVSSEFWAEFPGEPIISMLIYGRTVIVNGSWEYIIDDER